MPIPATTKAFIDNLINYYIGEVSSYKQMAELYSAEIDDVPSAVFGIILGSIYSSFLQAYANQKQKPSLSDIQEFYQIFKHRASQIKTSIFEAKK